MSNKSADIHSAEYIKTKIIDFCLHSHGQNKIIIGNEVMYGTSRKVVDLLLLTDNNLTAIEIKSENDNLLRLKEQIIEYYKNFNSIIICTTVKHLVQVRRQVDKNIGLLLYAEDRVKLVRKPVQRKKLNKNEILYNIPSAYLKQISKQKINTLNSDEVRVHYSTFSLSHIQQIYYNYMILRLEKNYKLFISERGNESHVDDIPLLSLRSTEIDASFFL